jgi:hypothetical protein
VKIRGMYGSALFWNLKFLKLTLKLKIMNKPGTLTFKCNICGTMCEVPAAALSREEPSCKSCGSTVITGNCVHVGFLTVAE